MARLHRKGRPDHWACGGQDCLETGVPGPAIGRVFIRDGLAHVEVASAVLMLGADARRFLSAEGPAGVMARYHLALMAPHSGWAPPLDRYFAPMAPWSVKSNPSALAKAAAPSLDNAMAPDKATAKIPARNFFTYSPQSFECGGHGMRTMKFQFGRCTFGWEVFHSSKFPLARPAARV